MTKLYLEDSVYRKDDLQAHAVVLRCWYEGNETIPISDDPLMRNLKPGEVGVAYYPMGRREICSEDEFELLDRTFRPGSVCKRFQDDTMSGIVLSTNVSIRVQHAITHELLDRWVPLNETNPGHELEIGDHIIYDDWIGQVIELFDEAIVQTSNGQFRRLPDLSAHLAIGYRGEDVLAQAAGGNPDILKEISEYSPPSSDDICLGLRHRLAAISWLAINQTLSPEESATRQRPKRLWRAEEFHSLTLVRRRTTVRIGEMITLRDHGNAPVSRHFNKINEGDAIEVRHFIVRDRQTQVTVLWQDGAKETKPARELVPHLHPDEYECWPGDHILWKTDGKTRTAVVHVVHPSQRVAILMFTDGPELAPVETHTASLLELDPHGTYDMTMNDPTISPEELGVHRGEFVFIHREGTTNGSIMPRVPKIGELESWIQDVPSLYTMQPGGFTDVTYTEGLKIIMTEDNWRDGRSTFISAGVPVRPVHWFGYVSDLCINGQIEVSLPHGEKVLVPLQRLSRLYDGLDQLEDMFEGGFSEEGSSMEDILPGGEEWLDGPDTGISSQSPQLTGTELRINVRGGADTERVDTGSNEESRVPDVMILDTVDPYMDLLPPRFPGGLPMDEASTTPQTSTTPIPHGTLTPPLTSQPHEPVRDSENDDFYWKRFDILASAPTDHAFYDRPVGQHSRTFMARLHKEYRALSTGLPASILVRAYEDRGDLLRSLIIGPENTPYEDAPFVIDWMLDADFPQTPPMAFFISWTNGNGRVNPNLYEDGKVCLSILGTWSGEKSETWQPSRSSLLQALVSIQGLVLVKEPYFCEPAYEKFRGTSEGALNSRLYNEKAYVLSRGFILRALERPPGSLENEIRGFYLSPPSPEDRKAEDTTDQECAEDTGRRQGEGQRRLEKVLKDTGGLISLSKALQHQSQTQLQSLNQGQSPEDLIGPSPVLDEGAAVPSLTAGGILTVQRVLSKLSNIQPIHSGLSLETTSTSD